MCTVYDRMYGDFPAKNTVCTLYIPINVWFWPTLPISFTNSKRTPQKGKGNPLAVSIWLFACEFVFSSTTRRPPPKICFLFLKPLSLLLLSSSLSSLSLLRLLLARADGAAWVRAAFVCKESVLLGCSDLLCMRKRCSLVLFSQCPC